MLGVASATLRRYSVQFADHLSPSASAAVAQGGGALERRDSESDIALLKRASGLLDQGLTFDQVRAQLGTQGAAPAHTPTTAPAAGLALVELVSGAQREAIAAQKQTIALLHAEVERLRAGLDQSQASRQEDQNEIRRLREKVQVLERSNTRLREIIERMESLIQRERSARK